MKSQSRVQLCGEIQIRLAPPITPPILAPTPILTLNTTITLTTWLKAKDAAKAKDVKIITLEQELQEMKDNVLKAHEAKAKDVKIITLEQELQEMKDNVLKAHEANEDKKRAKNRIQNENYKKRKSMSNALLQLQQVPVCAD